MSTTECNILIYSRFFFAESTSSDGLNPQETVGIIVGIASVATILVLLVLIGLMACKYYYFKRNRRLLVESTDYYTDVGVRYSKGNRDHFSMSPVSGGYSAKGVSWVDIHLTHSTLPDSLVYSNIVSWLIYTIACLYSVTYVHTLYESQADFCVSQKQHIRHLHMLLSHTFSCSIYLCKHTLLAMLYQSAALYDFYSYSIRHVIIPLYVYFIELGFSCGAPVGGKQLHLHT